MYILTALTLDRGKLSKEKIPRFHGLSTTFSRIVHLLSEQQIFAPETLVFNAMLRRAGEVRAAALVPSVRARAAPTPVPQKRVQQAALRREVQK